jgi:hypothetical protein
MLGSSLILLSLSFPHMPMESGGLRLETSRQKSFVIAGPSNKRSEKLVYVGEDQYSEMIFLDPQSVKRFGSSDEFWFQLIKRYGSGYQKLSYQGACASSAVKLLRITIYNGVGKVIDDRKFKEGWIYPQAGSVLRNALRAGCKLL